MPTLTHGDVISCSNPKLDIYILRNGILIDPVSLTFSFYDVTTTANQTNPVLLSGPLTINLALCNTGTKISSGHYTVSYTVSSGLSAGLYQARWQYQLVSGGTTYTYKEEVYVL